VIVDRALFETLTAVGLIILIGFPLHEFSHAWAANTLGDSTARYMGRLTLDPRVHIDPVGALILIAGAFLGFLIGWAKPTPVNPYNLRGGRRGEALVALAGPASNLIMAAAVAIPVRLIYADPALRAQLEANPIAGFVLHVAVFFVLINAILFIFNFLPIPPLDGWRMLMGVVDARTAYSLRQFEQYGFVILIALLLFGREPLSALITAVRRFLLGF
jgi:Zn-dependent protease